MRRSSGRNAMITLLLSLALSCGIYTRPALAQCIVEGATVTDASKNPLAFFSCQMTNTVIGFALSGTLHALTCSMCPVTSSMNKTSSRLTLSPLPQTARLSS